MQSVDVDKDVRALVAPNNVTTEVTTTELLMTDYFVSLRVFLRSAVFGKERRTFGRALTAASKR